MKGDIMTVFEFALSLENCLLNEVKELMNKPSQQTSSLLEIVYESQQKFVNLINTTIGIPIGTTALPSVDASLIGKEASWNVITNDYANVSPGIDELILYWKLSTLTEKTAQFYQQAALNSPYPVEKLFFTSCAEVKYILKRRIQGILQIMYNHIWGEIGFNPILFGKD